jgi:hypothetical protein
MAVKNYNSNPDLNTTISGVNIAEGCPPSGINNALRQLMADVRAYADEVDAREFLPAQEGHGGSFDTDGCARLRGPRSRGIRSVRVSSGGEDGDVWILYFQ